MKTQASHGRIREQSGQIDSEIHEIHENSEIKQTDEGEEVLSGVTRVICEVSGFDEAVRGSEAAASSKSFRCL